MTIYMPLMLSQTCCLIQGPTWDLSLSFWISLGHFVLQKSLYIWVVLKNCGNSVRNSSSERIWYFEAFCAGSGSSGSRIWTALQPRAWAPLTLIYESSNIGQLHKLWQQNRGWAYRRNSIRWMTRRPLQSRPCQTWQRAACTSSGIPSSRSTSFLRKGRQCRVS